MPLTLPLSSVMSCHFVVKDCLHHRQTNINDKAKRKYCHYKCNNNAGALSDWSQSVHSHAQINRVVLITKLGHWKLVSNHIIWHIQMQFSCPVIDALRYFFTKISCKYSEWVSKTATHQESVWRIPHSHPRSSVQPNSFIHLASFSVMLQMAGWHRISDVFGLLWREPLMWKCN